MPRKQTTVKFDEIFNYAEKEFNIGWNKCCDIFHRGEILRTPESPNLNIYKEDIVSNLKYDEEHSESKYVYSEDQKLGYKVLISFMKKHNLEEMYVINN